MKKVFKSLLLISLLISPIYGQEGFEVVPLKIIKLPPEIPSKPPKPSPKPPKMCWVTIEQGYYEWQPGYYYWGPWHWEDGYLTRYKLWQPPRRAWVKTGVIVRKEPCHWHTNVAAVELAAGDDDAEGWSEEGDSEVLEKVTKIEPFGGSTAKLMKGKSNGNNSGDTSYSPIERRNRAVPDCR